MLEELSIANIALVERAVLHFDRGFNCLTGETGAGKSILAGALGLIRGAKGELDLIRSGADEAVVSAVFSMTSGQEVIRWLGERGLALEDSRVLIRRILRRNGKAGMYIQGQAVSLKELTDFSALLFDLHGQHEHQSLFAVEQHRAMIDRFGGLKIIADDFYKEFTAMAVLVRQREKLLENQKDRQRQVDYLSYALEEIAEAAPRTGEDLELEKERRMMQQSEKLFSSLAHAYESLSASSGGALAGLYQGRASLHDAMAVDSDLQEMHGRVENLYYELEDLSSNLLSYQDTLVFEEGGLDRIEERLSILQKLKKKYGSNLDEVLTWAEESKQTLSQLENFDQNLDELNQRIKDAESSILANALELSKKRKAAALRLKQVVETALASLGMAKAVFEVSFKRRESEKGGGSCGPWGLDEIEFMLSANQGEPLKALKQVASGGEISRVMLAIKAAMADTEELETLVFDEVDTGIGGEVAVAVGKHLQILSRQTQILAITHLASIAVRADNHLKVEKEIRDGRTHTVVGSVQGENRVAEVARMLSGDKTGQASLSHARELLARYRSPAPTLFEEASRG